MTEELLKSILKDELGEVLKNGFGKINDNLGKIEVRLDKMDKRLLKAERGVTELKDQLINIDNRLSKLELIIENRIEPSIMLALEAHSADAKRLKLAEDVPELKSTVSDIYSSQKHVAEKITGFKTEIVNLSERVAVLEKAQ